MNLSRMMSRVIPRSVKMHFVEVVQHIASQSSGDIDTRRYRQEIDLLNYRIDEISTQLAVLSARLHADGGDDADAPADAPAKGEAAAPVPEAQTVTAGGGSETPAPRPEPGRNETANADVS